MLGKKRGYSDEDAIGPIDRDNTEENDDQVVTNSISHCKYMI